ncbi:MAG TPA: TIGR03618 family F420-dependent PPOX class oxidoreductase [Acidimicrobiales bacterium]|nr:TIGR03618 family F420-dependent PPOX class oxidoreductase [Acidimicrobiales bacterium]
MSRRDQIKMSEEEIDAFLHERHTLQVATVGASGRIHLVAMWYGFLDGDIAFWTYGKSQKVVNLRRDPRMTCLVETGDTYDQLRGVELVGRGEIVDDREAVLRIGESVSERYTGPVDDQVRAGLAVVGAKRVGVRLRIDSVVSWDHRKLAGAY